MFCRISRCLPPQGAFRKHRESRLSTPYRAVSGMEHFGVASPKALAIRTHYSGSPVFLQPGSLELNAARLSHDDLVLSSRERLRFWHTFLILNRGEKRGQVHISLGWGSFTIARCHDRVSAGVREDGGSLAGQAAGRLFAPMPDCHRADPGRRKFGSPVISDSCWGSLTSLVQ